MKRILYDVPKWHGMLGREARGWSEVAMAESDTPGVKFADELFDRIYSGGGEALAEKEQDPKLSTWATRFHEAAAQAPGWQRLMDDCRGDVVASAIATEKVLEMVRPEPDAAPEKPTRPGQTAVDKLRRLLTVVAVHAQQEVDDVREVLAGAVGVGGWLPGSESGKPGGSLPAGALRELAKRLRSNPHVKHIMELAGRFKRTAAQKRRSRVKHGADEITDVEQGDAIARMLPTEALRLMDPDLEVLFLRDWMERRLLQYRLSGAEPSKRGPVVVCIDKSGSMAGARDEWATAVAIAMLEQAKADRRPFALIAFDYGVRFQQVVPVGGQLDERALHISASGGTSIAAALDAALDIVEQEQGSALGRADVIVITDGGSDAVPEQRERAARLGVHIIGLGIGVASEYLVPFADEVHTIHDLSRVEDAAAAGLFAA